MMHHGDKSRAAGSGHLAAFFSGLDPLFCLIGCRHVASETDFDHIGKSDLFQSSLDGGHPDVVSELAFCCRSAHCDHTFAGFDGFDDIDDIDLGADRAERAGVNTMTAVDAFIFVDHAESVVIVRDGVDRAGCLAGTLTVDDGVEGAGFCAQAAGFALVGIDLHLGIARRDGAETAGVQTGFAEAETAAVRDGVILDGTVVAGGRNDGHDIFGRMIDIRIQSHGKADTPAYDLPFFIDAAPVFRLGTGADFIDDLFPGFMGNIVVPRKTTDFTEYMMLQFNKILVIGDHPEYLPLHGLLNLSIT